MGLDVSKWPFWDLTDVTLADEDTNSILTDSADRAIQGNVTIQVMQPGGQLWNQCKLNKYKWCYLVTQFPTDARGTTCWPNLLLMQEVPPGGWQGGCKEDWQQCGVGEGLPHLRPCEHQLSGLLPQIPPDPKCVAVSDDQLGRGDHCEERVGTTDPGYWVHNLSDLFQQK